jgi:RNA polymerase sigma-70 factor (ECF subfamily)
MDDAQAVRRLKGGDISGLEILVTRYQVKAARIAFLITHDEAAAEDITQETFVRLLQRIRGFDETRPFEPYLMRSIVNAALNHTRLQNHTVSLDADTTLLEDLLEKAAPVETQVEYAQLKQEILEALSKLSPRQRAAIVGRYYLDMSEQEMALLLDAPRGTIKWLLNAARNRLHNLLVPERSAE